MEQIPLGSMEHLLLGSWERTIRAKGDYSNPHLCETILRALLYRHHEPWRFYHRVPHLIEGLVLWSTHRDHIPAAYRVALAFFYHDCAHVPGRQDNEEQSALVFKRDAIWLKIPPLEIDIIAGMIPPTKNHVSDDPATQHLIDIDMSILATPDIVRLGQYEKQIRREFAGMSDAKYRKHRLIFLRGLQERDRIFLTDTFAFMEDQAQHNIEWLIAYLEIESQP